MKNQQEQERVEAVDHDEGDWRCLCGNRAWEHGFYPINEGVDVVDPTPEEWRTNEYVCARCGRVIDHTTRVVTRRVSPETLTWPDVRKRSQDH